MENLQKLTGRRPKAKVSALFSKVMSLDSFGRAKTVLVAGSNAKQYLVIIYRKADGIHTECLLSGIPGQIYCPGNRVSHGNGIICYHSMVAIDKALELAGYKGSWCRTQEAAKELSKMKKDCSIVAVYPGQYNKTSPGAYVVVEMT